MLSSEPILQSNLAHTRDNKEDDVAVRGAGAPSVAGSRPTLSSTMSRDSASMLPIEEGVEPKPSTSKPYGAGGSEAEPNPEIPITSALIPDSMRKRNRSHDENAAEPESSIVRQLRPKKLTRTVSPPLSNARLSNFVYALVFLTGFLMTYYAWRLYSWKMGGKGGISQVVWNRVRGNVPQVYVPGGLGPDIAGGAGIKGAKKNGAQRESVEDKIEDLARVLGMPSKELASAIAIAVREYVPPASLSSIAAKETGAIVDALVTGHSDYVVDPERIRVKKEVSEGSGVIGNVASGMGSFVGMEEP